MMLDSEAGPHRDAGTVVDIPASVVERIYDILLLEVLDVKVSYSDEELEMAQAAIFRMKKNVEQVLGLMLEHCFMLRLRKEAREDDLHNTSA